MKTYITYLIVAVVIGFTLIITVCKAAPDIQPRNIAAEIEAAQR